MATIVADLLRVSIELELLAARSRMAGHTLGDPVLMSAGKVLERSAADLSLIASDLAKWQAAEPADESRGGGRT